MDKVNIYLPDGTFHGALTMSSPSSVFSVVRVKKTEMEAFDNDLNKSGVYMLLIGENQVYVGKTGDEIQRRVQNTHSGTIDADWHTLLGFSCKDNTISDNELLFIENALCEFVHRNNHMECVTTEPKKENCNERYRKEHYGLSSGKIHICKQYVKDILCYIERIEEAGGSIFLNAPAAENGSASSVSMANEMTSEEQKKIFYFQNRRRDSYGTAEILIHCGHRGKRKTILKAGSKVSETVLDKFHSSNRVKEKRRQLEAEGKLVNRVLQEDIVFDSQSGAGEFLNGSAFDGNTSWKTIQEQTLKELL